ncbi:MAG: N-6 DNA methylase [Sulfurovum sp.]|nr:N-6 DNA methylase [Sulfurovum sp.]
MTMAETFKQFFTPAKYSQILINELTISSPLKIIDLAIGEGSLLIEAKKRWKKSKYYGNDIDINCCKKLSVLCPNLHCTNFDVFEYDTIQKISKNSGVIDLCIGNPPFHKIKKSKDTNELLKEFNLDNHYRGQLIPSEIPFILQSLKLLKENGTLALILPDGFFTNDSLSSFRKFLIFNYTIEKVIELPRNIFKNTPAKTHILILKKVFTKDKYTIKLANTKGETLKINMTDGIKRMDFSFYHYIKSQQTGNEKELHNIAKIFRGKSKHLLKDLPSQYILHTTSFKKDIISNRLQSLAMLKKYSEKFVVPGDIVLARVGTSVVGKISMIKKGYFIPTDCVIIIRANRDFTNSVFKSLSSKEGQKWIQAYTKGVAAQHITIEDIKRFPIYKKVDMNV